MFSAVQRSAVGEGNARARPLCLHCAQPVKLVTEAAGRVDQKLLYDKLRCGMARDMPVVGMSVRHPSRIARATTFVPTLYAIWVLSVHSGALEVPTSPLRLCSRAVVWVRSTSSLAMSVSSPPTRRYRSNRSSPPSPFQPGHWKYAHGVIPPG